MIRPATLITTFIIALLHTAHGQTAAGNFLAANPLLTGQDSAFQLLEQAMQLMGKSQFNKAVGSWDSLRSVARNQLSNATTASDAHPVINWCAQQAQLTHSFVMPKTNTAIYNRDTVTLRRTPSIRELTGPIHAELTADGIGYLNIPRISTTDPQTCTLLADSLQQLIRRLAHAGAVNWIIDLRANTGGNCWPMIAGMGPLLGEGICGYFVQTTGRTAIRYEQGAAWHNNSAICRTSSPFLLTNDQRQHIVVLTGAKTSSAGEIIALAFRGMNNVRFMGEPTAGFTTGNSTYKLMDGSMLVLSVCREADRMGNVLEGKLKPDDRITPSAGEDAAKSAAIMWLQSF